MPSATAFPGATTDILAVGQLFLDLVYAGLPGAPRPGEEQWTGDFGWGPGGIANMAIASARLGASTALSAVVGDDPLSALCLERLAADGVDVSGVRTVPGWSIPVTASLGFDGDRALVTGGSPAPQILADVLDPAARARVAIVHVDDATHDVVRSLAAAGTRVFADLGWDASGAWDAEVLNGLDGCYAFAPNDVEAMAFTRTDTPEGALKALAARVPLSVVTLGARGVLALDAATGERVHAAPISVTAVDSTGAGDVFVAALAVAGLRDWTLRQRIDLAALAAAITVTRPGGAATAPTAAELVPWLDGHPDAAERHRFAFLRDALPLVRIPSTPR
jgi:sugar/nucleoside kinase (ribokinase family)